LSRSKRYSRNVLWTLGGQAGIMAVNFFSVRYLIHGFGSEAYGVYLLMYAVASYLGLFQFGAGLATLKYVAEARAAGEDGALRDALRHSAKIHFIGVGLASAALWFGSGWLVRSVFEVPFYYRTSAEWLLRAAAVGGVFAAGIQWVSAAFQGFQRFAWPTFLSLFQALLMPLGLVGVLAVGRGLGAAAVWYVAVQAGTFAVGGWALWLAMREHPGKKGALAFAPFARYGIAFWPGALSSVASGQIDKTFVASALNISELTYYAVPSGILQRLQTLPSAMAHALMPVLSEADRAHGREELIRLYLRAARALFVLSLPPLALLLVLMPQFLTLWLGPVFADHAAGAARLLVLAQVCALAYHAPNSLAGSLGGGHLTSGSAWAQALLSLILWWVLIPRYGIAGAAAGALVAQAAAAAYFLHQAHRKLLSLSWDRFAHAVIFPCSGPTAVILVVAWLGRPAAWTWAGFLAVNAAATAAYGLAMWRILPEDDRRAAWRALGVSEIL
jgi:O-antigen/teichoic acid export membrane protein